MYNLLVKLMVVAALVELAEARISLSIVVGGDALWPLIRLLGPY